MIPNRFNDNITLGGDIEAQKIKFGDLEVDTTKLINAFNSFSEYIDDKIQQIAYIDNGIFKTLNDEVTIDISSELNISYDKDNNQIKDKDGNIILDKPTEIWNGIDNLNIKFVEDSNGNYIKDLNDKTIINNPKDINTQIDTLDSKINDLNIKYIEDSNGNYIKDLNDNTIINNPKSINSDISNLNDKINDLNIKYIEDSNGNYIKDLNDNTIINNPKDINTQIDKINLYYNSDTTEFFDNSDTLIFKATTINAKIKNIMKEIIYNVSKDGDGNINSVKLIDIRNAISFDKDDNTNVLKVLVDTDKIKNTDLGIILTPGSNSNNDIYILRYTNIQKDSDGNITGFDIEAYKLDGSGEDNFELTLLIKFS